MKATKRILQSQYNMSRAQAVMLHKDCGNEFETEEQLVSKVVETKNKWNEIQEKRKVKKKT